MAIECPQCRTVTRNDDAPECAACGRSFRGVKPKGQGSWQTLVGAGFFLAVLAVIFALQRC